MPASTVTVPYIKERPRKIPVTIEHACFLTEAQRKHLIQINNLFRALDCSTGVEPTPAKESIFNIEPTVTFDANERTDIVAFLAKSDFSVRMTAVKLKHSDGRRVPFSKYSFDYNFDNEEHKASASVAIMRNFYHARINLQADSQNLSKKFIEDIDHALVSGSTKEAKIAALEEVFNRYGHLWCSKVYLGGRLYLYKSNVHIDADKIAHTKADLQGRFNSKLRAHGKPISNHKEYDSTSPTNENTSEDEISVQGGNEQKDLDVGEWMNSVRNSQTWKTIEYSEVQPVYTLLDKGRRDMIEDLLSPPKKPSPRYLPLTILLHIITHKGNDQSYPFSLMHSQARMICLEDEAPHKGDGLHVVAFSEPDRYNYKVFQPDSNGIQGIQFRDYVKELKPFTVVLITETWSTGIKPVSHTKAAREAIFEGMCMLGLDEDKNDLQAKFGTNNGWLFIGYKDMETSKAVVLSRDETFHITLSSVDGRFAFVGFDNIEDPRILLELPDAEYQHKYLADHGWVQTTIRTRTTALIDRVEHKKVTVKKVDVSEVERTQ